jgi:hypothetical protein
MTTLPTCTEQSKPMESIGNEVLRSFSQFSKSSDGADQMCFMTEQAIKSSYLK